MRCSSRGPAGAAPGTTSCGLSVGGDGLPVSIAYKLRPSLPAAEAHRVHLRIGCLAALSAAIHVMALQTTAHVSDALSKGAKLLVGGDVPQLPEPLAGGNFYSPTVLAEATIDM